MTVQATDGQLQDLVAPSWLSATGAPELSKRGGELADADPEPLDGPDDPPLSDSAAAWTAATANRLSHAPRFPYASQRLARPAGRGLAPSWRPAASWGRWAPRRTAPVLADRHLRSR